MKLFGIGTDIVKISRIKKAFKKKTLQTRLFHHEEIQKCKKTKNSFNCFAKRFAAKEAFSKALGTGIAKGINLKEIVIRNQKNGKPLIKLLNKTKKNVEKELKTKKYKISLSLTDEDNYAVAFVTISL
tara:strand:- start:1442 stop:1825 length:384 start_codon:yes stop_codon:yes gene_type:complete